MDDQLAELLGDLRARLETGAPRAEVEAYLAERGYDARQIGEILSLLAVDRSTAARAAVRAPGAAFRVQGPHERGRFSPEAWGQLLRLQAALGMTAAELEPLVERALTQLEGRIGVDELRALLETLGFDDGTFTGHVTVH